MNGPRRSASSKGQGDDSKAEDGKLDGRARGFAPRWPVRLLGPAPGLRELNLACWGLFAGFVLVPLVAPMLFGHQTGSLLSRILPVDFVYFYGVGRLVRQYSMARLYDYALQLAVFNDIYAVKGADAYGPSPYPPFVALFFSLFARLPFLPAYLLWVGLSLLLYVTGIGLLAWNVLRGEVLKVSLVLCVAMGFYPFFISTLLNGQLTALAVFSVTTAITLERKDRPVAGGVMLAMLAYKPTLLLVVAPMLVVTRRFRMLSGFVVGGGMLGAIATGFAGFGVWGTYLRFLQFFRTVSVAHGKSLLKLWEYVDFTSFSYSVPGGRSGPGLALLLAIVLGAGGCLAVLLWRSAGAGSSAQLLAWAATLTWTLLLNFYVPVWDADLALVALLLTVGAVMDVGWEGERNWVVLIGCLMVLATWNMSGTSNLLGGRALTVLLLLLGWGQLGLLYRLIRKRAALPA